MAFCTSCGSDNPDNSKFCIKCGAQIIPSPVPGSWREAGERTEEETIVNDYPAYSPPSMPTPQGVRQNEGVHPIIPAVVSFFLPGIGLVLIPNKIGLAIAIFVGAMVSYVILGILSVLITIISLGFAGPCLFFLFPAINLLAAVHSWDEAAKVSNGKFDPYLFKK
jgi:hypothetical protein